MFFIYTIMNMKYHINLYVLNSPWLATKRKIICINTPLLAAEEAFLFSKRGPVYVLEQYAKLLEGLS
jgi:hypothetical protein